MRWRTVREARENVGERGDVVVVDPLHCQVHVRLLLEESGDHRVGRVAHDQRAELRGRGGVAHRRLVGLGLGLGLGVRVRARVWG